MNNSNNNGGRSSKLTPEVQEKIVQALHVGMYHKQAAAFAGISVSSFYAWIAKGEQDDEQGLDTPFARFRHAVEGAEAKGEAELLGLITLAARTSWQAAAWRLERKHPEKWARRGPGSEITPQMLHEALDEELVDLENELRSLEAEKGRNSNEGDKPQLGP
jgi:transposase